MKMKKLAMLIVVAVIITAASFVVLGMENDFGFMGAEAANGGTPSADVYVDDDANPGWYDATHVHTIQEGVENASVGDTIFVYNGTYNENVGIDKSISVIGEGRETTTITSADQRSSIVSITADGVTLSGFTLQDAQSSSQNVRGLFVSNADNCTISNIIIRNITASYNATINPYAYGIILLHSHNTVFSHILIEDIEGQDRNALGIQVGADASHTVFNDTRIRNITANSSAYGVQVTSGSHNTTLVGANVSQVEGHGISVTSSDNVTIASSNSSYNLGCGIHFHQAHNGSIQHNILMGNTNSSGYPDAGTGILLSESNHTDVTDNSVMDNDVCGIYLYRYCHNTWMQNNTVSMNGVHGIWLYGGFNPSAWCHHISLVDNIVTDNGDMGIMLGNASTGAQDVDIWDTTVTGGGPACISLGAGSYNVTVTGCDIEAQGSGSGWQNPYAAVFLENALNITVNDNQIVTNGSNNNALHVVDGKAITIEHNTIVTYRANGNGIAVWNTPSAMQIAYNNISTHRSGGYGIWGDLADSTIEYNTIEHYSDDYGLWVGIDNSSLIYNTVVVQGDGPAVWLNRPEDSLVASNTLQANLSVDGIALKIDGGLPSNTFLENIIAGDNVTFSMDCHGDVTVAGVLEAEWPQPPAQQYDIDMFVNVTGSNWVFLQLHYAETDVAGVNESTLHIWRYNDSWQETEWNGSRMLDTTSNIVGVNITSFSIFAPLAANSPPRVPLLTGPSSGDTDQSLSFTATATDPDDDRLRYGFDWDNDGSIDTWTSLQDSGVAGDASYSWSTAGTYTIRVVAEDEHGLQGGWGTGKTVTISEYVPPNQPPTVAITSPSDGATVSGSTTMQGSASDSDGNGTITKVEMKIGDDNWTVADGTINWAYNVEPETMDDDDYTIQARAYDGTDYSDIDSINITVDTEEDGGIPGFQFVLLLTAAFIALLVLRRKRHK